MAEGLVNRITAQIVGVRYPASGLKAGFGSVEGLIQAMKRAGWRNVTESGDAVIGEARTSAGEFSIEAVQAVNNGGEPNFWSVFGIIDDLDAEVHMRYSLGRVPGPRDVERVIEREL